jgi:hypothetical protein
MNGALATVGILMTAVTPALAQGMLPSWPDSAFRHSAADAAYDYVSQVSPGAARADLDGDGLDDILIEIRSRDHLDRGLAVIHQADRSVHILGAGKDVGDGNGEIRVWAVVELRHRRTAIRVFRTLAPGGLLVWNGHDYEWVAAS